jgi:hypothetical protein
MLPPPLAAAAQRAGWFALALTVARRVRRVCVQVDGDEGVLLDDSPLMPGLQMAFEAGMARFLIVP